MSYTFSANTHYNIETANERLHLKFISTAYDILQDGTVINYLSFLDEDDQVVIFDADEFIQEQVRLIRL